MRKIAIVYKSKRGSTKTYAEWIAEEVGADLFEVDNCKASDLSDYDTIVFGGYIRGGGLQGIEFLRKNFKKFRGKAILAFAVGINVDGIESRKECRDINFKRKLSDVPCYFLRGAYDPVKVTGGDKVIMGIMKSLMDDSNPKLRNALEHGADYVKREEIQYIVEALKKEE